MLHAGRGNPDWFIFYDPPRQTKLRGLVMKAFTPRMVAELEPRIREISRTLLDRVASRGEMDLAADYAVPPPDDGHRPKCWAFRQATIRSSNDRSDIILNLSYTVPGGDASSTANAEYSESGRR